VQDAADTTGERIWVLPTFEELRDDLKSDIADIANITGPASGGGSISAAMFLNEFVEKIPFVHIDIAGVANSAAAPGYNKKGGSAFGVQLTVELAKKLSK